MFGFSIFSFKIFFVIVVVRWITVVVFLSEKVSSVTFSFFPNEGMSFKTMWQTSKILWKSGNFIFHRILKLFFCTVIYFFIYFPLINNTSQKAHEYLMRAWRGVLSYYFHNRLLVAKWINVYLIMLVGTVSTRSRWILEVLKMI